MAEGPADLSLTGASFLPRAGGRLGGAGTSLSLSLSLAPSHGPDGRDDSDRAPPCTLTVGEESTVWSGWGWGARPAPGAWPHAGHTVSVTSAVSATTSLSTRELAEVVRRDADSGVVPSCTLILRNRRSHLETGLPFPAGDTSPPQGPGRERPAASSCCAVGLWPGACGCGLRV